MKHQKTQRENPFKKTQLRSPGVDRTASRRRRIKKLQNIDQISFNDRPENDVQHKRLDVDAFVIEPANNDVQINHGFVNVPQNKEVLHPARYFEDLFLHKLKAQGLSIQEIIDNLDISEEHFDDFLNEKVSVDIGFAKRLEIVTGMPFDFWLRTQHKFEESINNDQNT